jgi:Fic family protein
MSSTRRIVIDPPYPFPLRQGERYRLRPEAVARLERLQRARDEWRAGAPPGPWLGDPDAESALVRSVAASSEIEDEGFPLEGVGPTHDLAAVTQAREGEPDSELRRRIAALESIVQAGLWALDGPPRDPLLSVEFVCELHRRMFSTTRPHLAGRLKAKRNRVRGPGYDVSMLPPEKTAEFLTALCERAGAGVPAEGYAPLLAIAEFLVDFLAIHPFDDGNGRAARLLSTYLLDRAGYPFARVYPLDAVILERRRDFYAALSEAQSSWYLTREDLTPWIEFYIDAVHAQWSRAQERRDALR